MVLCINTQFDVIFQEFLCSSITCDAPPHPRFISSFVTFSNRMGTDKSGLDVLGLGSGGGRCMRVVWWGNNQALIEGQPVIV